MEDWITGTLAVLGTSMVLAGATLIVLRTVGVVGGPVDPDEVDPPAGGSAAGGSDLAVGRRIMRRGNPATQLISWGVLLLLLAAITVGLVSLGLTFEAGQGVGVG
jgi:hypothetical protein